MSPQEVLAPRPDWRAAARCVFRVELELAGAAEGQRVAVEVAAADEDHATDLALEALEQARVVGARRTES